MRAHNKGGSGRERFRQATAAALRAVAGAPALQVGFDAPAPLLGEGRAQLPTPPGGGWPPGDGRTWLRGQADRLATRSRYHDPAVHAAVRPLAREAAALFDRLEHIRCESLGARSLPGVADNLDALLEAQYRGYGYHRARRRQDVPVSEAAACLVRAAITGAVLPGTARRVVELWRRQLLPALAGEIAALGRAAHDQARFAAAACRLIHELGLGVEDLAAEQESRTQPVARPDPDGEHEMRPGDSHTMLTEQARPAADAAVADAGHDEPADSDGERPGRAPGRHDALVPPASRYKAFATEFDATVRAEDLCAAAELAQLRARLDNQLEPLRTLTNRLANRLQRQLQVHQRRHWDFNQEEGWLDSARLARVVANPLHPLAFKRESDMRFIDTAVTLLVDNSGSMRGRPITIAALTTDILARTLERCAVRVEILGYTTSAWKGGRSRVKWLHAGQPDNPGRLNDLLHIIYKPADLPWRRARRNIALMLKDDLPKQNVDGEALLWAHRRLAGRPEQRRILMVLSDGAPVDDSTLSVNGRDYLERHLRQVIAWIEQDSPVQLIGIGQQVQRYYHSAVSITRLDELGPALVDELARVLAPEIAGARAPTRH